MKQSVLISACLLVTGLALASCDDTGQGAKPSAAAVEPATASTVAASDPLRSSRGNIVKEVGQPGGIFLQQGSDDQALAFTVTGIEVDPVCTTSFDWPSENGHMVAITIEATTAPEPDFSSSGMTGVSFHGYQWKVIAPNGTTVNAVSSSAADNCFPASETIPELGPGEKAVGKVVLDVPHTAGTLVYSWGGNGWEWEYGTM